MITYEDGKNKHFEYFKMDSSKYLVYEFFRSIKGSSNEGLKSLVIVRVTNEMAGISTTGVRFHGENNKSTKEIHRYKALSKEGEWNEYEDSLLIIDIGQELILTIKKLEFGATIFTTQMMTD